MDKREIVYTVISQFIAGCLFNQASGFPQEDGTYALYRQNNLWLRQLQKGLPSEAGQSMDEKYLALEKKILEQIVWEKE